MQSHRRLHRRAARTNTTASYPKLFEAKELSHPSLSYWDLELAFGRRTPTGCIRSRRRKKSATGLIKIVKLLFASDPESILKP
jgi:hypothetical protein